MRFGYRFRSLAPRNTFAAAKIIPTRTKNFTDYGDMNMRYLRISGAVQRKGRGLIIVPAKH